MTLLLSASALSGCTGTIGRSTGSQPDGGVPGPVDGGNEPESGTLRISEIMYNPVLEEDFEDWHEFVEIHNPSDRDVSLDGWSLDGGISFAFPAGSTLPAGGYLVIAKSRAKLLEITSYRLDPSLVLGDYERSLANGGDTVALRAPDRTISDVVTYDDAAPWPVAADALGAGEVWLDPALLPLEQHRYRGHSLERVSFAVTAASAANWELSQLDAPTPGRANSAARPMPRAAVVSFSAQPLGRDHELIGATDQVLVRAGISQVGEVASIDVEYFVDDLERTDEMTQLVTMVDDGTQGDETAGDRVYSAIVPALPENSIVRYRIHLSGDGEARIASPRAGDPFAWHAYFVNPALDGQTRTYQLFISKASWTAMWTGLQGGRVASCQVREQWNQKVPAVFVHDGKVYDVRVRHQGSRYNRTNGRELPSWPYPGPAEPNPVRALSWRINFPRYARFEGSKKVVTLSKLNQSCPGFNAGVGFRLFEEAGIPSPQVRYARLHINGGYYHYMLELEHPGKELLERYIDEQYASTPDEPKPEVGHLFKAQGCNCDEGPYGFGDGRLLASFCGHDASVRYQYTYGRKTHEWADHSNFIAMVEGMHQARGQGVDALRAYFAQNFDIELMLNYLAVINWAVPFDDQFHNYYIYQRLEDQKWFLAPWDLDRNFGFWKGANASIFIGEEGDPDNRDGFWNFFKDSFIKAYRAELTVRIKELSEGILHPDRVKQLVDDFQATVDLGAVSAAPAGLGCDFNGAAQTIKNFAQERHQVVANKP